MKAQYNPQSYISLLIFLTGVLLVIYILMLPPGDRSELLEQNRTEDDDDDTRDDITILMTREPGRLTNIADDEIVHDLPSFNLFSRTDASILLDFDSIYISKSLFEEQQRNISFNINEFENTDNYVLSFTSPKHEGILTILLNDKIIHSNELSTASPSPITLPGDWLDRSNNLVFKVSGPGIEFWKSNEYILQDLKITADITDTSSLENKQIIVVNEEEKAYLESFELRFLVDCKASDVSPLQVYLNKRLIYSSVPDCGYPVQVPTVDETRIRQGENDLLFRADKGSYLVYSAEVTLNLERPLFPTYYFILDEEQYKDLKNDKADINVTLLFPNDVDRKKGTVHVNGFFFEINTFDKSFNRKVNQYVREGNNAVEIRPETEKLDVTELQVLFAE
jgi:hypothetical protein